MTPKERLKNRKISLPSPLIYDLTRFVFRIQGKIYHASSHFHFDPKELKGKQLILLADHSSRLVYRYVLGNYRCARFNTVIGYHNVFHPLLYPMLMRLQAIPKKLFEPDIRTVRDMLRILKAGGNLCIFPEGIQSSTGSNHPINPATADFLKKAGCTVLLCKSYGAYLVYPRYSKHPRKGPQELHYHILFTEEDLQQLNSEQIYDKLLAEFRYNDTEWNAKKGYAYRSDHSNAEGITNILYRCPKCGEEFKMTVQGDILRCEACGNQVRVTEAYALEAVGADSVLPYKTIDEWFKAQRAFVRKEIEDPNLCFSYDCTVLDVHDDRLSFHPYDPCGEGRITITQGGVRYTGSWHGKELDLLMNIKKIPSFMFDPGFSNDIFYDGQFYSFCPLTDKAKVVKYMFICEELHNLGDPKWNKVSRDAYDLQTRGR